MVDLSLGGFLKRAGFACHAERREASLVGRTEMLRGAQHDIPLADAFPQKTYQ